jgi:hypothetical protein
MKYKLPTIEERKNDLMNEIGNLIDGARQGGHLSVGRAEDIIDSIIIKSQKRGIREGHLSILDKCACFYCNKGAEL